MELATEKGQMSRLRPECGSSSRPATADDTVLFLICESVAHRRTLIHGRLHDGKGHHCAMVKWLRMHAASKMGKELREQLDKAAALLKSIGRENKEANDLVDYNRAMVGDLMAENTAQAAEIERLEQRASLVQAARMEAEKDITFLKDTLAASQERVRILRAALERAPRVDERPESGACVNHWHDTTRAQALQQEQKTAPIGTIQWVDPNIIEELRTMRATLICNKCGQTFSLDLSIDPPSYEQMLARLPSGGA